MKEKIMTETFRVPLNKLSLLIFIQKNKEMFLVF